MSAGLAAELTREEDRGRAVGEDAIPGIEAAALARLRHVRTMRSTAVAAGSAVVVGVAAWAITSTTEPSTLAAPTSAIVTDAPSPTPDTGTDLADDGFDSYLATADLSAEALIAGSTPRVLGEEPDTPRQAALLCEMDPDINPWRGATATTSTLTETKACEAVWVGDGPVWTPDFVTSRLVSRAGDHEATVALDWVLQWNAPSSSTLTIDQAAISATLATEPDTISAPGLRTRGAYVGESLWVSPTERLAVMGNATSPVVMDPAYSAVIGGVEITTQGPGSTLHSQALWAIAAREATPQVVVQVRVPPTGEAGAQELILEIELEPENGLWGNGDLAGLPAEDLVAGAEPRSRDDAARPDRQAASVCELPDALRARTTYIGSEWSPEIDVLECDPVWLGDPLFAAQTQDATALEGMPATYVQWLLTNTAGDAVRAGVPMLLVETRPARDATAGDLTMFDSLAVAPSAWTADGHRVVPLSDMVGSIFTQHVQPGNYLSNAANMSAEAWMLGPERDPDRVRRAVANGAQTTSLVTVPFRNDDSRVLVLEVPMGDTLSSDSP
ncbi:hypothetical protein [Demequina rhizosphaerae]|uniref:hypothetical protein n=1 Tax=Demequina rhizosphaerae TaxID=1638985 RepID=UPI000781D1CC|nr:hypothetical protein [Demequina rhizosphaerae]